MNRPKRIIIHHSATKDSGTVSWGAIRRYHVETNGWRDIGYHAGIEQVDDHFEIQTGIDPLTIGIHTKGHNANTLGFCFVGDYDAVAPSHEMLEMAVDKVLLPWCIRFGVTVANVRGHRDYSPKTCPGRLFNMDELREMIRVRMEQG